MASTVHDLTLGKGFTFHNRGRLRLKGFDSPMTAFEVLWRVVRRPRRARRLPPSRQSADQRADVKGRDRSSKAPPRESERLLIGG